MTPKMAPGLQRSCPKGRALNPARWHKGAGWPSQSPKEAGSRWSAQQLLESRDTNGNALHVGTGCCFPRDSDNKVGCGAEVFMHGALRCAHACARSENKDEMMDRDFSHRLLTADDLLH